VVRPSLGRRLYRQLFASGDLRGEAHGHLRQEDIAYSLMYALERLYLSLRGDPFVWDAGIPQILSRNTSIDGESGNSQLPWGLLSGRKWTEIGG
jgi:hypothetical protein